MVQQRQPHARAWPYNSGLQELLALPVRSTPLHAGPFWLPHDHRGIVSICSYHQHLIPKLCHSDAHAVNGPGILASLFFGYLYVLILDMGQDTEL